VRQVFSAGRGRISAQQLTAFRRWHVHPGGKWASR
jgi:hypothetical protein